MLTLKLKHILAGLVALLAWATTFSAQAYDVERNTSANRIYMLLLNDNPGAVYHSISISETVPTFVDTVVASIVPAAVNGGGSDLAALDFDVKPSASVGATGTIEITVAGQAAGAAINVVFTVPLEVVNSAPAAQGFVGSGEPTPNPGGTDTDGDGVPDSLEVAYGSNPNSASSIPGQVDTDGDGIDDGSDSAPNDPCIPSAFNAACTQDTDSDGKTDNSEGELTDTDGDGTPDYQESSLVDDDNDGVANELDATNADPCTPSAFNSSCSQDTDGDGKSDNSEGELTDTDGDGTPDYLESSIIDDDGDGVANELDATNTDPCTPSVFNLNCNQDTDGDGKTDGSEGELTDTDGDGTPDYQESSITDNDGDGFANEVDAANDDPCTPDPLAINCTPTEVRVPILGLPGYLLLGLLLTALGIKRTQRQPIKGEK